MFSKEYKQRLYAKPRTGKLRGPLEARLFALRRGNGSRIGTHVTQPMLARLLGCSVSYYQRMESGRYKFRREWLCRLADYYGVDAAELLLLQRAEHVLRSAGFPERDPQYVIQQAIDWLYDQSLWHLEQEGVVFAEEEEEDEGG